MVSERESQDTRRKARKRGPDSRVLAATRRAFRRSTPRAIDPAAARRKRRRSPRAERGSGSRRSRGASRATNVGLRVKIPRYTDVHTHTRARARTRIQLHTFGLRKNLYIQTHIVSHTIVLSRNLPRLHYH